MERLGDMKSKSLDKSAIRYLLTIIVCGFVVNGCRGLPKFIMPLSTTTIAPDERRFRSEWLESTISDGNGTKIRVIPCLVDGVKREDVIVKIWKRYGRQFLNPDPNENKGKPLPNDGGYELRSKDAMATMLSYLLREQEALFINIYNDNDERDKAIRIWAQNVISTGLIKTDQNPPSQNSF